MKDFRELKVWEKGHSLTMSVYRVVAGFPKDEVYGLTSQIRRSCASIPANIAEGCGRNGDAELAGSSRSPWAQQVNWNTIFCLPVTLAT